MEFQNLINRIYSPNSFFFFFIFFIGRPPPKIRWLVNGLLVDDQNEHNSGDVIENRLLWRSIQRTDLYSVLTCQTRNTLLVEAKECSYVLDMNCKTIFIYKKNRKI